MIEKVEGKINLVTVPSVPKHAVIPLPEEDIASSNGSDSPGVDTLANDLFREPLFVLKDSDPSDVLSSHQQYIKEISRFRFLTTREQIRTGNLIRRRMVELVGDEATELFYTPDTKGVFLKEKRELFDQVKKDEEYQEYTARLVNATLRMAYSIALNYVGRGLSLHDLIQEANFGLIIAAQKYDDRKGFAFTTYATHWVRHHVVRAIEQTAHTIHLPTRKAELIGTIQDISQEITESTGSVPSARRIAEILEVSEDVVESILRSVEPVSLNKPVGDGITIADSIEDSQVDVSETATNTIFQEEVEDMLDVLQDERLQRIVRLRFGFEDGYDHTLEEIGKEYGVTRERARQLYKKAMEKLKASSEAKRAFAYLQFME